MRFHAQLGSLASIAAAASLIAGCSGGGNQLPAQVAAPNQPVTSLASGVQNHTGINASVKGGIVGNIARGGLVSWFAKGHPTTNVFVADTLNGVVEIFDHKTGKQTGQIAGLAQPEGLATDAAGNLYEADTGTQTIRVYASPYSGSPKILKDKGNYPVGIHVDGSGNLWVANICSGSGGFCLGAGGVVEYKAGSTKPTALAGAPARSYFVTTNSAGDVWADGQDSSGSPQIGYFKGGAGAFKISKIALAFPGSLQFDTTGNLLLDDQNGSPAGGSQINIFAPGKTKPSGSITIQTTGDDVVAAALGGAALRIFAPLYNAGTTNVVTYPGGVAAGSLTPTTIGNPDAVAVTPATLP